MQALRHSTSATSRTAGKANERRVCGPVAGTVRRRPQGARQLCCRPLAATAPGRSGGSGLLDNPTTAEPGKQLGSETSKRKPPIYKVLLHNDSYNRREYVVKVLLKVVESITVDDAVNVMNEAHESGIALVTACAQDEAETYVESLRLNGLISTLEPGH